jgi:predicted O-methyltransferase YrrM
MGTEDIPKESKLALDFLLRNYRVKLITWANHYVPVQICMTRNELPLVMKELGYRTGAEIGVLRGAYSRLLCETIPDLRLKCVDPWIPFREGRSAERMEGHFIRAKRRLRGFHVEFIREQSMEAVRKVPNKSLDFVYIDAMHEFDSVMLDLLHWGDKVRPGGMIAGHDYSPPAWHNGVMLAVDTYTKAHGIKKWYITDEEDKSYFWVKP